MTPWLRPVSFGSLCTLLIVACGCTERAAGPAAGSAGQSAAETTTQGKTESSEPNADRHGVPEAAATLSAQFAFYTVDHYDAARDAAQDLAQTIDRAQAEHKHILVQVGGDWCGWCKRMSQFIESNQRVREHIGRNYLLMKVTYDEHQQNAAFLAQYPKIKGYPHLFVLSADGKLLHSQATADLEQGAGYNEQVYIEFLDEWKPER